MSKNQREDEKQLNQEGKMKSYLGSTTLKTKFVAEIKKHQEADQVTQGTYGENDNGDWRGCAVGCSIHSLNKLKNKSYETDDHSVYETELGLPEWLARLEDTIFEGLPKEVAMKWPLRFSEAIPVGVDVNPVRWQFCAFVMAGNIERVLALAIGDDLKKQVVDAIQGVLTLHENAIMTGEWDWSAAQSAQSAARSAAQSAESAAQSAAWYAWYAAESAESAAQSAAESAAQSAWYAKSAQSARYAWYAAESAAYQLYADKLIELLEAVR